MFLVPFPRYVARGILSSLQGSSTSGSTCAGGGRGENSLSPSLCFSSISWSSKIGDLELVEDPLEERELCRNVSWVLENS